MALLLALLVRGTPQVWAQDEADKYRWYLTMELSSVVTTGNSESSTLGFVGKVRRVWELAELTIDGGAVRADAALKNRLAIGTPTDYQVIEEETREKTAENYYVRGRYERRIGKRFTAFGGADWLRNPFAGIDSRFLMAGGAGNVWADDERLRFKTNYSVTYTFETEVVENPFVSTDFAGFRLGYDYYQRLTESTDLTSNLTADWNLDNTDDIRVILNVGLPIAISSKLAFKPSLNMQWRNDPALTEVPLFDPSGTDTGQKVLTPLEELDTIFTAALVVDI
jgi:putative salt-induced outer membrane protein YdiY